MKTKLVSALVIVAIAVFAANDAQAKNQTTTKSTAANVTNNAAKTNASWLTKLLKAQTETSPSSKTQSLTQPAPTCDMTLPLQNRQCDVAPRPSQPVIPAQPCVGRECPQPDPEGDI